MLEHVQKQSSAKGNMSKKDPWESIIFRNKIRTTGESRKADGPAEKAGSIFYGYVMGTPSGALKITEIVRNLTFHELYLEPRKPKAK